MIELFFSFSFVGYYLFQRLYFIYLKERKKRILENTVRCVCSKKCMFILHSKHDFISLSLFFANDVTTDLDYCLCTFRSILPTYSLCIIF